MDITQIIALSAIGVTLIQQLLKLKFIPVGFANRYPVQTNLILSVLVAVYVKWQDIVNLHVWTDWVAFVGVTALIAAAIYNQLLGKSAQLKAMEGES